MYAVCSAVKPAMLPIAPNKGARWADIGGGSSFCEVEVELGEGEE